MAVYFPQAVKQDNTLNYQKTKSFNMIDNYIYMYHTDTLIALPVYPESIQDSTTVSYQSSTPLSRSAPIYSYSHSGPRTMQFELQLHRDMMNDINVSSSRLNVPLLPDEDYVDVMVKQLQAMAYPRYAASEKMVNPPIVAVRFGNSLFCKGVVEGSVAVTHSGPILYSEKYAQLTVTFSISEIDPYDADIVILQGGFRGLRTSLESRIYKKA